MSFEGFPLVVGWELTLECNLRCDHCASTAGLRRSCELTESEALSICDQFPALLVQEVDFTGGEPLMCSWWPAVARKLSSYGIQTRMVTNGTLLRQNAERLAECGIKTIGVSIDGLEATHDRVRRRPGLFRTIVDGIKHAKSVGIPVAAITAVNNNNIDELPFLREFLGELGIGYWQVQPTFALGRAKQAAHLELSDRTFIALGDFVKRSEAKKAERQLEIVTADGLGYHHPLKTSDRPWKGCHAGLASCGITSEGSIKACLSLPDHLVEGNLRERDLWDIWFDERSFAINRRFVRCNLGENCHSCAHGETCRGGCMVMSIAATGRANNDPYCLYRIHEAIRQSGSQPKPCGLQLSE